MDPSHPFRLGGRFLRGRTLSNAVTRAAAAGVAVGTAAMIVVLSAFNGLENLILTTYEKVHPDLTIIHEAGGRFTLTAQVSKALEADTSCLWIPIQIQKALLRTPSRELLVDVIGMPRERWAQHPWMDSLTAQTLSAQPFPNEAAFGYGVGIQMGLIELSGREGMELLWPGQNLGSGLAITSSFVRQRIAPERIFYVHPQVDQHTIVLDAQTLSSWTGDARIDAIHAWTADPSTLKKTLQNVDPQLLVQSPQDREAALFRVMKSEGLITTAILSFIVLLASLGLYSATVLLGMEKEGQRSILRAMGMPEHTVRLSFWWSGIWVSALCGCIGWILGSGLVAGQAAFGWVPLGNGYVVTAYPVHFSWLQSIAVGGFVVLVGAVLSWLATRKLKTSLYGLRGAA